MILNFFSSIFVSKDGQKRMFKHICIPKIDTDKCLNKYLYQKYLNTFVLFSQTSPYVTTFYIETVINGYETGLMLVSFICLGYTRLEAERLTGRLTPAY